MVRAGVDPGLLDEVSWWRTDDLWFWALQALVTYVRAAAEHSAEPVTAICGRVASRTASNSQWRPDPARQNARLEGAQNIGLHAETRTGNQRYVGCRHPRGAGQGPVGERGAMVFEPEQACRFANDLLIRRRAVQRYAGSLSGRWGREGRAQGRHGPGDAAG
jgi:hypothetical protein